MGTLGMTALGVFIGAVITIGIRQIKDWSKLRQLLTTLISAALAGAAFTFIQYVGESGLGTAIFFYPVGLVLGLGWANAPAAAENLRSNKPLIGWLHIVGLAALTFFVVAVLFSPSFRSLLPSDICSQTQG
jgi:hypothetical protein